MLTCKEGRRFLLSTSIFFESRIIKWSGRVRSRHIWRSAPAIGFQSPTGCLTA
jgi:hypothetical protein